jgi:hypothetical protein
MRNQHDTRSSVRRALRRAWILGLIVSAWMLQAPTASADGPRRPSPDDQWVPFGRTATGAPGEIQYNAHWFIHSTENGEPFISFDLNIEYDQEQDAASIPTAWGYDNPNHFVKYSQYNYRPKIYCQRNIYIVAGVERYLDRSGRIMFFEGNANPTVMPSHPIGSGTVLDTMRKRFCPK